MSKKIYVIGTRSPTVINLYQTRYLVSLRKTKTGCTARWSANLYEAKTWATKSNAQVFRQINPALEGRVLVRKAVA